MPLLLRSPGESQDTQGQTEQPTMHTHTFSSGQFRTPINLTIMFLDCGRKEEYPERAHGEKTLNPDIKFPGWDSNPRLSS